MVLENAALPRRSRGYSENIEVDHEPDRAVRIDEHAVDRVVPRAPLAPSAPKYLREAAEVDAVAREGHRDERLAISVVPSGLAHVHRKETNEHVLVGWVAVDAGKVDVAGTFLVVPGDINHAEVLVGIDSPWLARARDGHDHEAAAMELQIRSCVHEPLAVFVRDRQLPVKHHDVVNAAARVSPTRMPSVESILVL